MKTAIAFALLFVGFSGLFLLAAPAVGAVIAAAVVAFACVLIAGEWGWIE